MASRILSKTNALFRPATTGLATRRTALASRSFTNSPAGLRHKEDAVDLDPEKHKQDLLAKQKEGKGHWKPELASTSEEAVKADRNADEDISELQERTKAAAEDNHKSGTSMKDGL
ncbi:hypothetical protein F4778DRAFT_782768 [Xylariomycetidae sp. FL2044]|nr:hypothetical protein F4778DRAFT_782768 [Xylariomycetidae sp. FL2044]